MPPSRAIRLVACLALLGLSACASTVPWPPPAGSCVEASIAHGKGARWRYRILGRAATRGDVEHAVATSPEAKAAVVRSRRLDGLVIGLAIGGLPVTGAGIAIAAATAQPLVLLVVAPALAATIVALSQAARTDDPFRRAVVDFNARMARDGNCPILPMPPLPPWHPPAPTAPVPEEDLMHPRYGPPPFGR